jgi:hypothetical protein
MTDKKSWELTKLEIQNTVEMDDVFGDFKTIERMAQKKMLEYIYSYEDISVPLNELVKEFGLDKNK